MDRETARNIVLASKMKREKIDTPWWPEFSIHEDEGGNTVDDRLEVRELSGEESLEYQESLDKNGVKATVGNTVVKALLLPGSYTPLLNPTDRDALLKTVGISALEPILKKILLLSGIDTEALENAKKN